MGLLIRDVQTGDGKALLDIYAHYVLNSRASFEETVPSLSEFENRIASIRAAYSFGEMA